jgi:hypothetical protein
MPAQNPRVAVELKVPNVGTPGEREAEELVDNVTTLSVRAYKVRIEYNNHNAADECSIECSIDDAGIDPRFLRNAEVYVYLDDIGTSPFDIVPTVGRGDLRTGNLRFLGIVTAVERMLSEQSKHVVIRAQDYTCLFLQHKSGFSPKHLPSYSDTLASAWAKICDGTGYLTFDTLPPSIVSTVSELRNRIVFEPPTLAVLTLGSAVSPRASLSSAKVQIPHTEGCDAWAVWQHIVGALGLITFIRGSQCVVTTATDFYSGDDPPRMIWGLNIAEIHETRDQHAVSAKNICIYSFNPFTGTHLESFYPPKGDITPKGRGKKKIGASALGPGITLRAQDYEVFQCPMAISDQAALDKYAERVWQEHGRQELKGTLKTPVAAAWTNDDFAIGVTTGNVSALPALPPSFSLLGLQAGDRIRIEIDQAAFTLVQAMPSLQGRIGALIQRGYSPTMAQFICKNLSAIQSVSPEYQVHSSTIDFEVSSDGGKFEVTIDYLNRVYVSGSAKPGDGVRIPAIEGVPL